jgi:hypothetical protein
MKKQKYFIFDCLGGVVGNQKVQLANGVSEDKLSTLLSSIKLV